MDCSTPGLPVHHKLPETTQAHVHCVGDAIQPSHPLSAPFPSIFASIRNFSSESVLRIRWPKDWSFSFSISPSHGYSGLISFIQQHYLKQAKKKKKWKQPKCPWMDEWINKMWYWEKFTPITLLSSHHHIHFQKLLYPQTVSLCVCVCACALVPQLI